MFMAHTIWICDSEMIEQYYLFYVFVINSFFGFDIALGLFSINSSPVEL